MNTLMAKSLIGLASLTAMTVLTVILAVIVVPSSTPLRLAVEKALLASIFAAVFEYATQRWWAAKSEEELQLHSMALQFAKNIAKYFLIAFSAYLLGHAADLLRPAIQTIAVFVVANWLKFLALAAAVFLLGLLLTGALFGRRSIASFVESNR